MAKLIGKQTWKNLYYYLRREFKKSWKGYAIIAGGVFLGVLLLILWITYADWTFRSTYKNLLR